MAKLWAGRFGKETDLEVNDFNSSISFDCRLYKEDITGSMAHAAMLGKQGIIAKEESDKIIEGLKGILADIEAGKIHFSQDYEDIHMNVEQILTERIGDAGKRLHTARSRNDQVALDMRLYVKKEIVAIKKEIIDFMEALCESAKNNLETVMPGYTHLQRAQPVTFGHYMMAYANMMRRDVIRLENCLEGMDDMPLGSGALASTTYPIDRDFVRQQLGFARVTNNSLDGVSDRDYCVELTAALSILMMHLSRFSEEIISWCSWEFKFVELDDAFSTGSSIMPQKKNPDNRVDLIHLDGFAAHVIHHTPRRTDDNLHAIFKGADLASDFLSAVDRQNLDAMHVFCQAADLLRYLDGKFTGRAENDRLRLLILRIDLL